MLTNQEIVIGSETEAEQLLLKLQNRFDAKVFATKILVSEKEKRIYLLGCEDPKAVNLLIYLTRIKVSKNQFIQFV